MYYDCGGFCFRANGGVPSCVSILDTLKTLSPSWNTAAYSRWRMCGNRSAERASPHGVELMFSQLRHHVSMLLRFRLEGPLLQRRWQPHPIAGLSSPNGSSCSKVDHDTASTGWLKHIPKTSSCTTVALAPRQNMGEPSSQGVLLPRCSDAGSDSPSVDWLDLLPKSRCCSDGSRALLKILVKIPREGQLL